MRLARRSPQPHRQHAFYFVPHASINEARAYTAPRKRCTHTHTHSFIAREGHDMQREWEKLERLGARSAGVRNAPLAERLSS